MLQNPLRGGHRRKEQTRVTRRPPDHSRVEKPVLPSAQIDTHGIMPCGANTFDAYHVTGTPSKSTKRSIHSHARPAFVVFDRRGGLEYFRQQPHDATIGRDGAHEKSTCTIQHLRLHQCSVGSSSSQPDNPPKRDALRDSVEKSRGWEVKGARCYRRARSSP